MVFGALDDTGFEEILKYYSWVEELDLSSRTSPVAG